MKQVRIMWLALNITMAVVINIGFGFGIETAQAQATYGTSTGQTARSRETLVDPFNPGWNTQKIRYGIGFGTALMGSSSTLIFERYDQTGGGFSAYLGLSKSADSYIETSTATASGTSTITNTVSQSRSGSRSPFSLSLAGSYNRPVFRNEWLMIRVGAYGGLDYSFKTSYDIGSRSEATNTTTGDVAITETGYGSAAVSRDPVLKLGPVMDAYFFMRWFPHIAIGMQTGIVYVTPAKTTTESTTRTRSYSRVGGVDQTPTSDSGGTTRQVQDFGSQVGTIGLGGTTFSLYTNFGLRYVW